MVAWHGAPYGPIVLDAPGRSNYPRLGERKIGPTLMMTWQEQRTASARSSFVRDVPTIGADYDFFLPGFGSKEVSRTAANS